MYLAINSDDMVVSEGETIAELTKGLISNDFSTAYEINQEITFYLCTKINIRAIEAEITLEIVE